MQKKIAALEKQNRKLQQFYDAYQQVQSNEKERVKELNCLYQVAQCVVLERDTIAALKKIVHIIPTGWQFTQNCCARIRFRENIYLSPDFCESDICQTEKIYIDKAAAGAIAVYYHADAVAGNADPFLNEERNLLKGIANIISLAAGVAHELNEPLGNILGLAQLSLKLSQLPEQARNDLTRIQECVMYSREIIKKLLAFSRNAPVRKEKICLNHVIENSLTFLAARCAKEGIAIEKRFQDGVFVMADANQINQVVTNLTINAVQAMGNGGKLTLTVKKAADKAVFSMEDLAEKGLFRQDLFFRINVITVDIPPLRERGDDILLLAKHFIVKYAKQLGKNEPKLTQNAIAALKNYTWPGNVRELENLIHRNLIMNDTEYMDSAAFPAAMKNTISRENTVTLSLSEMTRKYVREVLSQTGGNKAKALKILKIDRKTLLKKL